jgi:hypothetical protein
MTVFFENCAAKNLMHVLSRTRSQSKIRSVRIWLTNGLWQALKKLVDMPMGRAGQVVGTYEKPVARTSPIIVYQATVETLRIVRIIHAKRNSPEEE